MSKHTAEHRAPDSIAATAAAQADADAAAVGEDHPLLAPAIDLTGHAVEQQARFRALADEGRPGAQDLFAIYVEDEKLQSTAALDYEHFRTAGRAAIISVSRYDSLRGALDQDGDLASNFTLGASTGAAVTDALAGAGADRSAGSLSSALDGWKLARRALVAQNKIVRAWGFRVRAKHEQEREAATADQLAEIDAKIAKVEKIGAAIDVAVGAATGGGWSAATGAGIAGKLGEAAGADVDVTTVSGVAKVGARLYYGDRIEKLRTQLAASKEAAATLGDAADRLELEGACDHLERDALALQIAAKEVDDLMDERRRQYEAAGKAADADARSTGADEGEASETLLLGAAAEEAALVVSAGRDAAADAETSVGAASRHGRARAASYYTEDDMFEISGVKHYLPRGRSDDLGDDPDLGGLYRMTRAIRDWQAAADEAEAHLAGATTRFRAGVTGDTEY